MQFFFFKVLLDKISQTYRNCAIISRNVAFYEIDSEANKCQPRGRANCDHYHGAQKPRLSDLHIVKTVCTMYTYIVVIENRRSYKQCFVLCHYRDPSQTPPEQRASAGRTITLMQISVQYKTKRVSACELHC
jgi:hypothetical protein